MLPSTITPFILALREHMPDSSATSAERSRYQRFCAKVFSALVSHMGTPCSPKKFFLACEMEAWAPEVDLG